MISVTLWKNYLTEAFKALLNALRAIEIVARGRTLSAAAAELGGQPAH